MQPPTEPAILITRPDLVRYPSTALARLRDVLRPLPRAAWEPAIAAWKTQEPPPEPGVWEGKR